jgi:hypothetical protein
MRTPRVEDEEGWSSEDDQAAETEREKADFAAATGEVLAKASGVFEDVVDDFSSLRSIKQRFEEWRTEHSAGVPLSTHDPPLHCACARMRLTSVC